MMFGKGIPRSKPATVETSKNARNGFTFAHVIKTTRATMQHEMIINVMLRE
jgi:hypothetical protein